MLASTPIVQAYCPLCSMHHYSTGVYWDAAELANFEGRTPSILSWCLPWPCRHLFLSVYPFGAGGFIAGARFGTQGHKRSKTGCEKIARKTCGLGTVRTRRERRSIEVILQKPLTSPRDSGRRRNHGNYIVSLGSLCAGSASRRPNSALKFTRALRRQRCKVPVIGR